MIAVLDYCSFNQDSAFASSDYFAVNTECKFIYTCISHAFTNTLVKERIALTYLGKFSTKFSIGKAHRSK